ncbi:hypothetical protein RvY_00133 [Ramazzottius varieornatus]|uniref:CB1 cannabinoid receptor-interacting protein 1 n=1 Tax=Ramazzottius varieornatus TaxID=947166 RepID=A0A1D1UI15_RAMVA|nr:hypothetical protein RvY_00133 [Ramazzottius varieornatus]
MPEFKEEFHHGRFRLTIYFRRKSDERPVVFKSDGERFPQPLTVKFQQEETYTVTLTTNPAVQIEYFTIHEQKVELTEEIKKSDIDQNTVTYHGEWKTESFPCTKRCHREQLKLFIQFKNHRTFLTSLQSKFYALQDCNHSSWGESMTAVQYVCDLEPGYIITIVKQHVL